MEFSFIEMQDMLMVSSQAPTANSWMNNLQENTWSHFLEKEWGEGDLPPVFQM